MILIILLTIILVFYIFNIYIVNKVKSHKVSVIILNYNRPHNLKYSIPKLIKYNIIDDIIISHGKADTFVNFRDKKVRNFKDYKLDTLYGGARRYIRSNETKNNIILFIDDDMLPSEFLINYAVYKLVSNNKNTIYGAYSRYCYKDGYSWKSYKKKGNYNFKGKISNAVITNFLICKKNLIQNFLNHKDGFKKYKSWYLKNKGNCEDLSLSLFIKSYYNEYPESLTSLESYEHILMKLFIKKLDEKNGYSSNKNHLQIRNNFCKLYNISK